MITEYQKELISVMVNRPEDLRKTLSKSGDIKYALAFLNRLLPYRIGLEIDTTGTGPIFQELWRNSQKNGSKRGHSENEKRRAVRRDTPTATFDYSANDSITPNDSGEIRFTAWKLNHYKQLKKVLDKLIADPYVYPASNGGMHIHTELGFWWGYRKEREKSRKRINSLVFKPYHALIHRRIFKLFNKNLASMRGEYSNGLKVRRHHETIEWRLGTPTFNYAKVMKVLICCSQLTQVGRDRKQLDEELINAVLSA